MSSAMDAAATRERPRPGEPDRTILAILLVFVLVWTAFNSISRYNLDVHGDMVENFAWGIGWQLGYHKHPPLFSWITAAWFTLLPRDEIAYFLLSSLNIASTLFVMQRIATRFLDDDQRVLLVACGLALPPLTFLATNYNATSAMLPFWALTFLFYLRVLEKRSSVDAILLGLCAGLAMLTKYHSAVLLLAIATHMVADRDARALLATRLPWLTALAGAVTIAPHAWWVVADGFGTIRYASEQGDGTLARVLGDAAQFLPAIVLYALPAYLVLLLHRHPGDGLPIVEIEQFRALWRSSKGRALVEVAALPIVYTLALALVFEAQVSSLWSIPFFAFLPFLMVLCLPAPLATRRRIVVPIVLAVYAVALFIAAPFIERAALAGARSNTAIPIRAIAGEVEAKWRARAGTRLAIVAGERSILANGIAFHGADRPYAIQDRSLARTPWVTRDDIDRLGAAFVCTDRSPERCRRGARSLLGRIDEEDKVSVAVPDGAGGPERIELILYFRLPR